MISQEELPKMIEQSIPELSGMWLKAHCNNAYDMVRQLLKYTTTQVLNHNLKAAQKCMVLAEQLYQKGNGVIQNAIENVYVYSFSHAFFCDENKKNEVIGIVPHSLYELYKKQVVNSHL